MKASPRARRFPIGAEVLKEGGVSFRVWADKRKRVEVVLEDVPGSPMTAELTREEGGYFSRVLEAASAGTLYRFRLDGEETRLPDPASRFQPDGPHGPSKVVDPAGFVWSDTEWRGLAMEGQVIYETHIGTFTPEGTWAAAEEQFQELVDCGITVIEMMPVADFPGRFGWGYDGVDLFAPTRLYGSPDDLRLFVNNAHLNGLGVVLDVVYNHLGPDGNYLPEFSDSYLTDRYENEWGKAINFDGENSRPVREFFITNAHYWIAEFHFDGLRLDATQSMYDSSPEHIIRAVTRAVREAGEGRGTIVIAENEPQRTILARPERDGGYGVDALWNDDFHHSAFVALTGRREAYYTDYLGSPQEFISMLKWGYLYQGQYYSWQSKCRGMPAYGIPPACFVLFIENHDQVANSCCGFRIHQLTSPALFRTITALLLLAPGTPMLFQGQEFGASTPFLYFADLPEYLNREVYKGRLEFLHQFPSLTDPLFQQTLLGSSSASSFQRSKLDLSERESHPEVYKLHKDLLKMRREDTVFRAQAKGSVEGAVLANDTFALRFFGEDGNDRLLTINFGRDLNLQPAPEPLLAPPEGKEWKLRWSSEDYGYGGRGTPPFESHVLKKVLGKSAMVFIPVTSDTDCRISPDE